jgi:general secretion pathway protein I
MATARAQAGFTLIEVVVAFVMLTLVLSVGFQIFATGMARAGDLDDRSHALDIAQSQLDAAGTVSVLREGQSQGDSEDRKYHWVTTVSATDEGQPRDQPPSTWMLWRVEARVDWMNGSGRPQSLTLSTLSLGQRNPQ